MNQFGRLTLVLLIFVGVLTIGDGSRSVTMASFDGDRNLIIGARVIVRGAVRSVGSRFDAHEDRIFTYIKIEVEETLKGELAESEIVLKEEGGETSDRGELVFGTPKFVVGERVLAYLDTWPDGSLRVYQMCLGKFSLTRDGGSDREILLRDAADGEAFLLRGSSHGDNLETRIDAAEYFGLIRETLHNQSTRVREFFSSHYQDTPMVARPPEYDAALESDEIRPFFSLLPLPARWFEPDQGQPIIFFVNPDGAPNAEAVEDVAAAIDAWATIPGTSARLVNGGARSLCSVANGFIVVTFNNCDGRFQEQPGCDRIIARGGIVWDSRIIRQTNGQGFRKAIRGFVSLNPYSGCSFENHCNLREIVTHEIGHALGVGHSQYPEATMYGVAHSDGRCASLRTDDARALAFAYPVTDPGFRPPQITTESISDGIVGSHFLQVLEAEGGTRPYRWGAVFGAGRPPEGITVIEDGGIIGGPLRPETSSFDLEVVDANGARAVKRVSMTVVAATSEFTSRFLSQSVPTTLQVGQQFTAVIRWLNTGTSLWDPSRGFNVRSQYPTNNSTWGASRISSVGLVQPEGLFEARLTLTAPAKPGAYDFQWQLHQEGLGIFGEASPGLTLFVYPTLPLSIDGSAHLQPAVGLPFTHQFTTTGGSAPFSWSIASGTMPAGLSLNASTGVLSGTATMAGASTITLKVTDANSQTAQRQITIEAVARQFGITTTSLPGGIVGTSYATMLSAVGGAPPYTWSISSGTLPAGLSLGSATGVIQGTPINGGSSQFEITARDQMSRSVTSSFELIVGEPDSVPSITKAKYKSAKTKLIVTVMRADPEATLFVDGLAVSARLSGTRFVAKRFPLAAGPHEVRVVNPGGIASPPFTLEVR